MIQIINGNLFDAKPNEIICHQVNCQGRMGKGIAKTIREQCPDLFSSYVQMCDNHSIKELIGKIFLHEENNRVIANLFAQKYYGNDRRHTDYEAVAQCLEKLSNYALEHNMDIAIPYGMGCNNAGGNWNIVYTMIKEICTKNNVTIYKGE